MDAKDRSAVYEAAPAAPAAAGEREEDENVDKLLASMSEVRDPSPLCFRALP